MRLSYLRLKLSAQTRELVQATDEGGWPLTAALMA
jgi:hypothetical protein